MTGIRGVDIEKEGSEVTVLGHFPDKGEGVDYFLSGKFLEIVI